MKSLILILFAPAILAWCLPSPVSGAEGAAEIGSFAQAWQFVLGDPAGAHESRHDDSTWESVDLPHDWSIRCAFDPKAKFGGLQAFLPAGIGWYRKSFTLPGSLAGKHLAVEFDGVLANSEVWINGHPLGQRPNGYVGFNYELTPWVVCDGVTPNVIAVRVDNSVQPSARWYTGYGIYRHVRIRATEGLRLSKNGIQIATVAANEAEASVLIRCTVENLTDSAAHATVRATVHTPTGEAHAVHSPEETLVPPHSEATVELQLRIPKPALWSPDSPGMHSATFDLTWNGRPVDRDVIAFGIRDARFEAATGFWINGQNVKLKGVGLHQTAGAFGAAVPPSIWEQRLRTLKEIGVNAIRTGHSPVSPEFLDLCDRLGLFVVDEFFDCWAKEKLPGDYHRWFDTWAERDAADIVRQARNHPSVILYSLGNEIRDTREPESAKTKLQLLQAAVRLHDPSRPTTMALYRPTMNGDYRNGLADMLDVIGQNYREEELLAAHREKPSRKIVALETTHSRESWLIVRDNPAFAGQFIWAGIDYLGESRHWPVIGWGTCLLDRTGQIKPRGYQRMSWWSERPMVFACRRVMPEQPRPAGSQYDAEIPQPREALVVDWTPRGRNGRPEQIEVYSNCDQVELRLNGRSLGALPKRTDLSPRTWSVPFEPGTLEALASNSGEIVATHVLQTAGAAKGIALTADQKTLTAKWEDVVVVEARLVDGAGATVPDSQTQVVFSVEGPGEIVAVDNGNNIDEEPFVARQRTLNQGRCVAYVRARAGQGKIQVRATAAGLLVGVVEITLAE